MKNDAWIPPLLTLRIWVTHILPSRSVGNYLFYVVHCFLGLHDIRW